jgi:hypothetical protein
MRGLLLASIVFIGASASVALAGEGNGEPFPGPDFVVVTRTANAKLAMKGQDPFSYAAGGTTMTLGRYKQAVAKTQDPFPFAAPSTVIQQQNPSALAQKAAAGTHG